MIEILKENPLLLLFLVAAIGYPLGRVRLGGTSLGVAAVLFVGLAFGALDPDLEVPEVVYQLGLVLFVYTIGLSSGAIFFTSLARKGLRYNLLVIGGLVFAAVLAAVAQQVLRLPDTMTAGMFAGSVTNTPALAGAIEYIKATGAPEAALTEPVIAYSLTYPIGVLGMILVTYVLQRLWKVDYAAEARAVPEYNANEPIESRTIQVKQGYGNLTVAELIRAKQWSVVFARMRHDDKVSLVTGKTILQPGDLVTLVGTQEELDEVTAGLGDSSGEERLEYDISHYDKRRILVSNPEVVGRQLRSLDLIDKHGAIVTRLRRGDVELIPNGSTLLAPGDQLRVVAPRTQMNALARLFGDSFRAVSEIDILTFSLGMAIGLLLGMVPFPLGNGVTLRLGIAGGPLLVALLVGALGRTGRFVWNIPYSANLTLRQIGLVFFLAGIGTRAGYSFVSTITQGSGLLIFAAGAVITCLTTLVVLWVGYKLLKIPMGLLLGILSGLQTQPAVLGFSLEQSKNELPNIGYASVYPVAMILKIVLAQALLILLR